MEYFIEREEFLIFRRRILPLPPSRLRLEFSCSSISIIYLLFLLSQFPRKFLKRGRAAKESISSTLLHRIARLHKAWIRKWNFFSSSRKRTFSSKESILRNVQSWARATFLNRGGRKEKMDRWRETRFERTRSSTRRRIPTPAFSTPFLFTGWKISPSRRLFNSSAHVAAPLKGELSPETRASPPCLSQSFHSPTTFARAFCVCTHHVPLPLVHTQVSHGKCQFAERTILACAIRARLAIDARLERERETTFVLRDTV